MTILFPGQGSQFVGMGKRVFQRFPDLLAEANELLGYRIEDICLNDYEKLKQTNYTQPAIFTVSVLMYLDFIEQWNYPHVNALMGHSLGEYAALYAAGVFDFKTGLKLVKKRGELMSQVENGTMAAIIGMEAKDIEAILLNHDREVYVANYNSDNQVVIAGKAADLKYLQEIFTPYPGIAYHLLPVSGAFHSPFMTGVSNQFRVFLDNFQFKMPRLPVIANHNSMVYKGNSVKENLVRQINNPVFWKDGLEKLVDTGETFFYEAGPGNVLTKLMKSIAL